MEFATPSAAAVTNAEEMVLIVSITRGSPFCAITSLTFFHWELSRILSRKSLPSHVKEPTPKLHKLLSAYYEKGDRRKRAHHLITRGAAIESVAPLTTVLTETEFYAFAEKALAVPEIKGLLMEAVNEHNRAEQKERC